MHEQLLFEMSNKIGGHWPSSLISVFEWKEDTDETKPRVGRVFKSIRAVIIFTRQFKISRY